MAHKPEDNYCLALYRKSPLTLGLKQVCILKLHLLIEDRDNTTTINLQIILIPWTYMKVQISDCLIGLFLTSEISEQKPVVCLKFFLICKAS